MLESDKPRPDHPPVPGKAPLPRVWKAGPDPDEEARERLRKQEEERERRRAARRASKPEPTPEPRTQPKRKQGALVEATPEFDTYDARRRVRLIVGGIASLACLGVLGYVISLFLPDSEPNEELFDEGALAKSEAAASRPEAKTPERDEQAAKLLMDGAVRLDRQGKREEALAILKKIRADYPDGPSGSTAKAAIARSAAGGSLFTEPGPSVIAEPDPNAQVSNDPLPAEPPKPSEAAKSAVQVRLPRNTPMNPIDVPSALAKSNASAKPLPPGFTANPAGGVHESGWPILISSDRDGAEMALIPAGVRVIGRDGGDPSEAPSHPVTLSAYYMDRHEVTVRQYKIFLRETARKTPQTKVLSKDEEPVNSRDDYPYVYLTAREALDYCAWAGKRLPTEAQWEAAARWSDGRSHPWGDYPASWERERTPRKLDPVMSYPSDMSPYGVFDLAGNAEEWTKDYFDSRYYQQFVNVTPDNPAGPTTSRSRPPQVTVKGGSKTWHVAWREGRRIETRFPYLGFRGVLPLEQPTPAGPTSPSSTPARSDAVVPF